MRSGRNGTRSAIVADVQPNARSPTETASVVIPRHCFDRHIALDLAKPTQRVDEHVGLQSPLAWQSDVAKFGATGTVAWLAVDRGLTPNVLNAVW